MNAWTSGKTYTAKEMVEEYVKEMEKLSAEYQAACRDENADDYYVGALERKMDRMENLAYLYMALIPKLEGSSK